VASALKSGADPNSRSQDGYLAIEEACYRGHLYDVGKNLSDINARLDISKLLLERGADLRNAKTVNFDISIVTESLVEQRYDVTRALLKHGAPKSAITLHNAMLVRLPFRVRSRSNQRTYFQKALASTREQKYLNWALYGAIEAPDSAYFLERLLQAGADVNYSIPGRATPLWYAVQTKNVEAVRFLLSKGADPNIASVPLKTAYLVLNMPDGTTPLAAARKKGNSAIITLLEKAGAKE
jgi:ankyrin repeat protein